MNFHGLQWTLFLTGMSCAGIATAALVFAFVAFAFDLRWDGRLYCARHEAQPFVAAMVTCVVAAGAVPCLLVPAFTTNHTRLADLHAGQTLAATEPMIARVVKVKDSNTELPTVIFWDHRHRLCRARAYGGPAWHLIRRPETVACG